MVTGPGKVSTSLTAPSSLIVDPFNDRLSIQVAANGRFNMGAFPDPSTGAATASSWDLMFRWPNTPGTSFTTVRTDGSDTVYGTGGTQLETPTDINATTNESAWQVGDIIVTQTLQLAPNNQTGYQDNARIVYTISNVGTAAHAVGVRTMIDTEINYNDGAVYRIRGQGVITHEREFDGTDIPDTMYEYSNVTDNTHVAASTLQSDGATPPDRLVLASWPKIYPTTYDYTPDPSLDFTNDSAYALFWNPLSLAPGETRTYATLYGIAHLNTDLRPPLALGVTAPVTLSVSHEAYTPNPFTVIADVYNNGTATAHNTVLTLNLPPGLSLTPDSAPLTQPIGDLAINQEQIVSWKVLADPETSQATLTYGVTAVADGADPKTLAEQITLPAIVKGMLTLAPATGSDTIGSSHTLTANATEGGVPDAGRVITFTVTGGPQAGTVGTATTDATGNATFSYVGNAGGTDTITAQFVDAQGISQTSNTVTEIWVQATPTATNTPTNVPSSTATPISAPSTAPPTPGPIPPTPGPIPPTPGPIPPTPTTPVSIPTIHPPGTCGVSTSLSGWSIVASICSGATQASHVVVVPPAKLALHPAALSLPNDALTFSAHNGEITINQLSLAHLSQLRIAGFTFDAEGLRVSSDGLKIALAQLSLPALRVLTPGCNAISVSGIFIDPAFHLQHGTVDLGGPVDLSVAGASISVSALSFTDAGLTAHSLEITLPPIFRIHNSTSAHIDNFFIHSDGTLSGTIAHVDVNLGEVSGSADNLQLTPQGFAVATIKGHIERPVQAQVTIHDLLYDGHTFAFKRANGNVEPTTISFGGMSAAVTVNLILDQTSQGKILFDFDGRASVHLPPALSTLGTVDGRIEFGTYPDQRALLRYAHIGFQLKNPIPIGETPFALNGFSADVCVSSACGENAEGPGAVAGTPTYIFDLSARLSDVATHGFLLQGDITGAVSSRGDFGFGGRITLVNVITVDAGICVLLPNQQALAYPYGYTRALCRITVPQDALSLMPLAALQNPGIILGAAGRLTLTLNGTAYLSVAAYGQIPFSSTKPTAQIAVAGNLPQGFLLGLSPFSTS